MQATAVGVLIFMPEQSIAGCHTANPQSENSGVRPEEPLKL